MYIMLYKLVYRHFRTYNFCVTMYPYVPQYNAIYFSVFGLNYSVTMIGLQKKVSFFQFILIWNAERLVKGFGLQSFSEMIRVVLKAVIFL